MPSAASRSSTHRRPRDAGSGGFLWRHLIGDYSLARSYWLHLVLFGWCLSLAAAWGLNALSERSSVGAASLAMLILQPLFLLVWVWAVIGATMSALRTLINGPSPVWAFIALFAIAASTVSTAHALTWLLPAMKEHFAVAMGRQPTATFTVTLSADGRVIAFAGGVNEGAARAIDRAIGDAPKVGTLLLDSPGGWMREGQRMAEVVKRYRLNTRVEKSCYSACTLVFMSGENRSAGEQAQIGFHRSRAVGASAKDAQEPASREEAAIYRKAGLHDDFVSRIVATPNDSILVPTRRELLREDVLTR